MKKIFLALALFVCLGLAGCYKYVAEHPEKTAEEFRTDQAECENQAREYMQARQHTYTKRDELTRNDEIEYTRRCMRGLGWEYHLRKKAK